jgi:hypothetical protein
MEVRIPRTQLPVPTGAQAHITTTKPPDIDDDSDLGAISDRPRQLDISPITTTTATPPAIISNVSFGPSSSQPEIGFTPMEVRIPRTQLPLPAGAQAHITTTKPPDTDDDPDL